MFDHVKCLYPLPLDGANNLWYQTYDTPNQFLDFFYIKADGTLWEEKYDTEDRSPIGKWKREHPGEEMPIEINNLAGMCGAFARINQRLEPCDFTGALHLVSETSLGIHDSIRWVALFDHGKLLKIEQEG